MSEWSESPPGCTGVVKRNSKMSGNCREALPDVREALPDFWEWSESPPECTGVVGRPTRMSE